MIRINDYIELSFLKFLSRKYRDIEYPENMDFFIEDYLKSNCEKWNLKFFIKLFQDFIIGKDLEEKTLEELMSEFLRNCNSLIYIRTESIDKRPVLRPYLSQFVNAMTKEDYLEINNFFKKSAIESYENNTGLEWWFEKVIKVYRYKLLDLFSEFSNNTLNHNLFYEFVSWKNKKEKEFPSAFHNDISVFSFDERRRRLEFLVCDSYSFHQRLQRLQGLKRFQKLKSQIVHKCIIYEKDYNFLYISFLHYLESQKINIAKGVTYTILMQYVNEYCQEFGQNKLPELTRFAKSINKKDNLFKSLLSQLFKKRGLKFSFDRIKILKAHGLILFPKHENLSRFLEKYWEDIHFMTDNIIDIYFTEDDFKFNISGYKRLNNMPNMQIKHVILPVLLVWEKFGEEIKQISLKGLKFKDIFNVIELLKNKLEKDIEFQQCVVETNNEIAKILEGKSMKKTEINISDSKIMSIGDNNTLIKPRLG